MPNRDADHDGPTMMPNRDAEPWCRTVMPAMILIIRRVEPAR
jgi:hypothetical protein